ncbi:SPbeta prophage-derived endonuclease YokF [Paenibacillus sp. CECT 9249]|uniref:thermonuclease family protein n=1 Tax=Paenibacillus sp. CECT 9249 TaxID=2845385 RepID=UPI001E33ED18|nr:thermonuclease family protein [Paenibacillus sp. CECT 9249]CAH0120425.1 SPbeta prophage-derived endonuclease YokF [Paenibacillus sp. CECT 9249]
MRTLKKMLLCFAALAVMLAVIAGCSQDNRQSGMIDAKIVRVVDGDTMEVSFQGKKEKLRLLLVDTPETVHPNKPVEPFGSEASQFAKETLEGQNVKLELDVSERDKYGRLLAYLWIGDRMFNEMLLEEGLARVAYVYPPNVKYVDRFREIQKEAQLAELGIWSIENYATDKGFDADIAAKAQQNAPEKKGSSAKSVTGQEKSSSQIEETKDKSQTTAGCKNPTIKGNKSKKGELIYHVPGGQSYEVTKAEEMFCTEEEAQAAGYRKAKR